MNSEIGYYNLLYSEVDSHATENKVMVTFPMRLQPQDRIKRLKSCPKSTISPNNCKLECLVKRMLRNLFLK